MESLSSTAKKVNPSTAAPPIAATQAFVGVTSPQARDVLPLTVPTASESEIHGNNKGTDDISPHEIDLFPGKLNNSCVELSLDLVTPSVLENHIAVLIVPSDHIVELPTVFGASIAESNYSVNLNVPTVLHIQNGTCDFTTRNALDHILLISHDEMLAKNLHDTSLWSIMMEPPLSQSHATNKIAELTCLTNVYAPKFAFNLIGEYDVNNEFLVGRLCINVMILLS